MPRRGGQGGAAAFTAVKNNRGAGGGRGRGNKQDIYYSPSDDEVEDNYDEVHNSSLHAGTSLRASSPAPFQRSQTAGPSTVSFANDPTTAAPPRRASTASFGLKSEGTGGEEDAPPAPADGAPPSSVAGAAPSTDRSTDPPSPAKGPSGSFNFRSSTGTVDVEYGANSKPLDNYHLLSAEIGQKCLFVCGFYFFWRHMGGFWIFPDSGVVGGRDGSSRDRGSRRVAGLDLSGYVGSCCRGAAAPEAVQTADF